MCRTSPAWRTYKTFTWTQRTHWLQVRSLLLLTSIGLQLFGFRKLQGVLLQPRSAPLHQDLAMARASASIVRSAARWNPMGTTCLTRSLVLCWLLQRQRLVAVLRIGIQRQDGQFRAHAWVEVDDIVITDSPNVAMRFLSFDAEILRKHAPAVL